MLESFAEIFRCGNVGGTPISILEKFSLGESGTKQSTVDLRNILRPQKVFGLLRLPLR